MSDENAFDMKKFMCLMMCPCTMCCGMAYMNSAMKNPPDAEKLSENEAKKYMDQLQGTLTFFFDKMLNFGLYLPNYLVLLLGVKIRNWKVDFKSGGTWRWVRQ